MEIVKNFGAGLLNCLWLLLIVPLLLVPIYLLINYTPQVAGFLMIMFILKLIHDSGRDRRNNWK